MDFQTRYQDKTGIKFGFDISHDKVDAWSSDRPMRAA
jgi:hypothetical protein